MARPVADARHPRRSRLPDPGGSQRRWLSGTAIAGMSLFALVGLGGLSAIGALSPEPSPSPSAPRATLPPSPVAIRTPAPSAAAGPSVALPPSPSTTPAPSPTASPSASPLRHPAAAPTSAAEFDLQGQVILIGFPMREGTSYRFRDNWGDPREGAAEHYNHAHSRHRGELLRAHDGIDIYARRGEPVLSPFDGVVIDPETRWQPWIPERYGHTAVIVSQEETSAGYVALLSHLNRLWVEPGQHVRRGEVIGTVGSTGNAEGGPAHLHFELRAPFGLMWTELGDERKVDAFNPFPSLVAADPRRSD
jgi:murein DD-endopeptidase MepM/ murein hydrolase activator NlpD